MTSSRSRGLLLPARWWPDTLPAFKSGGWWQRPHTQVRCRQCIYTLVENPSFRSSKCHGCEKQMKNKGKRLDSIVFTNANPRRDMQGNWMIRKKVTRDADAAMMVNREMKDKSSWIWITSEQMGFPLRSEFANENHGENRSLKQCNDQRTVQTVFFLAPITTDFIQNTKRELNDEKLEDAFEMFDLELSKDDDTKTQCNRLNTSQLHRENASKKNGPSRVKWQCRNLWNPARVTPQKQHAATYCNTPQHIATKYNKRQHMQQTVTRIATNQGITH